MRASTWPRRCGADIVLWAAVAVLPKTPSITILQTLACPRRRPLEHHETSSTLSGRLTKCAPRPGRGGAEPISFSAPLSRSCRKPPASLFCKHLPALVVDHWRTMKPRKASRVVLLNERDEVLLIRAQDLLAPSHQWWMTCGGGSELGESAAQTAARELAEETGIECEPHELIGPLATR